MINETLLNGYTFTLSQNNIGEFGPQFQWKPAILRWAHAKHVAMWAHRIGKLVCNFNNLVLW